MGRGEREIYTLQGSELSACIGAAKLGFMAIGQGADLLQSGMGVKVHHVPDDEQRSVLETRYARFHGLLSAAKKLRD